jgi:hypothetical protein
VSEKKRRKTELRLRTSVRLTPATRAKLDKMAATLAVNQTDVIELLIANARFGSVKIEPYPDMSI